MDRETYPNPRVVDLASKLIPVKIDAGTAAGAKAAAKYKVEAVPAIFFLDSRGAVVHSLVGYMPAAQFAAEMQKALARAPKPHKAAPPVRKK